MINNKEMTIEELEKIVGGTIEESVQLIIPLAAHGHGYFIKPNYEKDRHDLADIEGMQKFFATKGYKFIPGFGDQQNVFIDPEGQRYGNDYIIYLINNETL
jgi:bacteriocin-like protein